MSNRENDPLDRLADAILASAKYKNVCEDFIRNVGLRELSKQRSLKDAIKATKNKLHQVGGAYLDSRVNYARWLDQLRDAHGSSDREKFLKACRIVMSYHASTRERLEIIDRFYTETLAGLSPLHTVLDIACGLNPLAIPWMPLAANAKYYAIDIYQDMINFLNEFMALTDVQCHALAGDVLQYCPTQRVDIAFLLKTIPCLGQVDKFAGIRLLEMINADYLLVSFPVHTLGGRDKGMVTYYANQFRELVAGKPWDVKRFEFATELAFLVTT